MRTKYNDNYGYRDMYGEKIEAGMFIKHKSGEVEKVFENWDGDDIGLNATNRQAEIGNQMEYIYPLTEFDLREWKIVDAQKEAESRISEIVELFNNDEPDVGIFAMRECTQETIDAIEKDKDFEGISVIDWNENTIIFKLYEKEVRIEYVEINDGRNAVWKVIPYIKKELHFYHDQVKGYVLEDKENEVILMVIPMNETYEPTIIKEIRSDVKKFLKNLFKGSNQTVIVQDCLDESVIEFEKGEAICGYSHYDGYESDKKSLALWGFIIS